MSKPRFTHDGWDARSYDLGAARERRRIRRALKPVMEGLRREHRLIAVDAIDAATRSATRGKR